MMDTGFFKWLWRFNAVAIALAAVLFLILGVVIVGAEFARMFFSDTTAEAIPVSDDASGADATPVELHLDPVEQPTGTDLLRVALTTSAERYGSSFSKYPDSSTLNVGFIDPVTLKTRWLFPDDKTLILQRSDVYRTVRDVTGADGVETRASLYLVVSADTTRDGQLSLLDKVDLMVSSADGSGMRVLVEGAGSLQQTVMMDAGTELIIYTQGDETLVARMDMQTLSLTGPAIAIPFPRRTD